MSQVGKTAGVVLDGRVGQRDVLASDADRDAAAGMLSSAFAEGRLTAEEHSERVRAACGARTLGELAGLTADLPGPAGDADGRPAVLMPDGADRCPLCALLILCPPAGIAWLLAGRRRSRTAACRAQRPAPAPGVRTPMGVRGWDW
jgi:hypothetical protein